MRLKNIFIMVMFFILSAFCGDKHYRGIVDYLIDAAKGNIPGNAIVNKFGTVALTTSTDPATVWHGGGIYPFTPDSALYMEALSSSASDSGSLRLTGIATGGSKILVNDNSINFIDSGVTVGDLFVNDINDEYGYILTVDSFQLALVCMSNNSQVQPSSTENAKGDTYRIIYSDSSGAGAIAVYGLDSNYLFQNEIVLLSGTNEVMLTKRYVRQWRAVVLKGATRAGAVGTIEVRDTTDTDTACIIAIGDNQTQQAFFTIPADKKGYLMKAYVVVGKGAGATAVSASFTWRVTTFGGVKSVKGEVEVLNTGAGKFVFDYAGAPGVPPRADIEIICEEVSATVGVEAGFDVLLSDL